jgi:hypothetical protein
MNNDKCDQELLAEAYEPVYKRTIINTPETEDDKAFRYERTTSPMGDEVRKRTYNDKVIDTTELSREELIERLNRISSAIRDYNTEEFYRQVKIWGWDRIYKDNLIGEIKYE